MAKASEMSRGQAGAGAARRSGAEHAGWRESVHKEPQTWHGPPAPAGQGPLLGLGPHLGLTLLQQCLQTLLRCSSLMVIADQQDDMVPVVDSHHLKPHTGLMGVGWYSSEEAQVDALWVGPRG